MATECNQCGQGPCPTPQACELAVDVAGKEPLPLSFKWVIGAVLFFCVILAMSAIARYF